METGPKNLITDVDGILVGHAQDDDIKSGVSVLTANTPFNASYMVMGGAPGTRDTDLLEPDKTVSEIDAIVLSGGSAFGLDAATGVSERLRNIGRGFRVGQMTVPIVPTAILFDLSNGGNKDWAANTYQTMGSAAYDARGLDFDLGTIGAGAGALSGQIKGGLGSASIKLPSGGNVGAMMAANPIGNVIDTSGKFWAAPFEIGTEFGGLGPVTSSHLINEISRSKLAHLAPLQNTTIGIVATDLALNKAQLKRLATAAHDGIAHAIVPSHLPFDGDLIFAISTRRRPEPADNIEFAMLCHSASVCVARSIARGVYHAKPAAKDVKPTWRELYQR